MSSVRVDFDQIAWDNKSAGMRIKRMRRHDRQVRIVEIRPDSGEADWCDEGHVGYVLEGELEMSIGGAIERLSAGDGIIIPGGKANRHRPRAVAGVVRLVLVDDA